MIEQIYYDLLYTTLLANSPVDTGNMVKNIKQYDMGDYYLIVISGPKKIKSTGASYDYAKDVNYNRQRTPKESKNYKWVERTIQQVSEQLGEVEYELS